MTIRTIGRRFYWALALVAVLALASAAVAATSRITSAGGPNSSPSLQACDQQDDSEDASETAKEDTDNANVEEQCGDQNEADEATEATEATEAEDVDAQADDKGDVQEPSYSGSITVDDSQYEGLSDADEAAALQQLATITADQAKATAEAANPGISTVKVELDNENGVVVYGVELSNGLDVKVDAGNGNILHTEHEDED